MNKQIYFIIGASNKLGTGHFFRSVNLAKKLKNSGNKVNLIVRNKKEFQDYHKIYLSVFNKIINFKEINSLKISQKSSLSILIVDDPRIDFDLQKLLYKYFGRLILYQDMPKKNFCDVLVNHNIIKNSLKIYRLLSQKKTKLLLGEKYFLLNSDYPIIKSIKIKKNINITIFFGGLSNNIYLTKILEILTVIKNKKKIIKVNCVLGKYAKDYNTYKKKFKNIKFHKNLTQLAFYKLLANTTMYIGSGGSSLFESLKFNIKCGIFCTAKNQLNNCKNLSQKKIIYYFRNHKKKYLAKKIDKMINNPSKNTAEYSTIKNFSINIGKNQVLNYI